MSEEEEYPEDFNYIVRLMNTDLDGEKPTLYALRDVKGIGTRVAECIIRDAKVSSQIKIGLLGDDDVGKLNKAIKEFTENAPNWMVNRKRDPYSGEYKHLFGPDLDMALRDDLNRLKKISCYRGIRHESGHKVRGQRTRSNGRTGLTVGVHRKRMMAK